jgi:DNA polymerase III delta prime subunit
MHRLSEYQKHSVKRKESIKHYYMTECLNLTIVQVANSGKETHAEVLHRQLTGEQAPRTHQTPQGNPQNVHLSSSWVV